ncbi:Glutathione S-transferase [Mesorhizobium albiziae]|uniref:Glutathione S-transferase n=1 Tax=Neomesorhizobium albiziae TaxID=335020 RepID=A0A1I3Z1T0_9HYPH|nr:glutathione S-transferase family protein [Mesorhizobium albiziae]GLS33166.1 glutathione S-transferase [Mesorhizobium albiziae]SFK37436.1 Glutathione S-transferase [Mesorhizobium albiziae]
MKLYSRPLSPYSSIVRAIAYIKDAPLKIMTPPPGFPIPEEFRRISPLNRIPVLITGSGVTIVESSVIAEYLEEHFPEPPLLPADSKDRALVRMFARIVDLDVLVPTMKLFELYSTAARDNDAIDAQFKKLKHGLRTIEARMAFGPHALGDQLTFADAWLTPTRFIFNNFRTLTGRADLLDAYPKFNAYESIAIQHPQLSRVWSEMADGLKVFLSEFKPEKASQ